jgi:hypothetical protein
MRPERDRDRVVIFDRAYLEDAARLQFAPGPPVLSTPPLVAVSSLPLQADFEGPTLISGKASKPLLVTHVRPESLLT